jgi:hypothetical protein
MNCNAEMPMRAEHCPRCGQRSMANFEMMAESVFEDAAKRRGLKLESALRWILIVLVLVAAFVYGFNDLCDKPLVYDGSALPALPSNGIAMPETPTIEKPYVDPRPSPPVSGRTIRVFGYRLEPVRSALFHDNKGDVPPSTLHKGVREAIDKGLEFLARRQSADGSFAVSMFNTRMGKDDTESHKWAVTGVTSLAALAFMGEGESWLEEGGKKSPHGEHVKKAIKWLIDKQNQGNGCIGPTSGDAVHFMYNHGLATLALCEAAGLSGDEFLRGAAQKGVNYIVKTQSKDGGWTYEGTPAGADGSDASVTAWQVQALHAAREAGLDVPDETLSKALELYRQLTKPDGRVLYDIADHDPNADQKFVALRGIGLMMRQLLGEDSHVPILKVMAHSLEKEVPETRTDWGEWVTSPQHENDDIARSRYSPYKMYFATYGMFMLGGKEWEAWHEPMKKAVLEMQASDGAWYTNDVYTKQGGVVYSTAISVLTLQVYYRIH